MSLSCAKIGSCVKIIYEAEMSMAARQQRVNFSFLSSQRGNSKFSAPMDICSEERMKRRKIFHAKNVSRQKP